MPNSNVCLPSGTFRIKGLFYAPIYGFLDRAFALATSASLFIQVTPINLGGRMLNLGFLNSTVALSCAGTPGTNYDVQRATVLPGPWTTLSTLAASTNGLFNYTDSLPPQPDAFYRLHKNTGP